MRRHLSPPRVERAPHSWLHAAAPRWSDSATPKPRWSHSDPEVVGPRVVAQKDEKRGRRTRYPFFPQLKEIPPISPTRPIFISTPPLFSPTRSPFLRVPKTRACAACAPESDARIACRSCASAWIPSEPSMSGSGRRTRQTGRGKDVRSEAVCAAPGAGRRRNHEENHGKAESGGFRICLCSTSTWDDSTTLNPLTHSFCSFFNHPPDHDFGSLSYRPHAAGGVAHTAHT